jgi:hypothetical protein
MFHKDCQRNSGFLILSVIRFSVTLGKVLFFERILKLTIKGTSVRSPFDRGPEDIFPDADADPPRLRIGSIKLYMLGNFPSRSTGLSSLAAAALVPEEVILGRDAMQWALG